jgi:hypothetical protein
MTKPILCPHGILGKTRCRECTLKAKREAYIRNKAHIKKRMAEYYQIPENKIHHREYQRAYAKTEKYKKHRREYQKKYNKTPKAKGFRKKYRESEKFREARRKRECKSKKYWVQRTIYNHKKQGHIVEFKAEDLLKMVENIDLCSLCGRKLDWKRYEGKITYSNRPTLDRLNNENIMTLDTVQIICLKCNSMKFNCTIPELIAWAHKVIDKYENSTYVIS